MQEKLKKAFHRYFKRIEKERIGVFYPDPSVLKILFYFSNLLINYLVFMMEATGKLTSTWQLVKKSSLL